MPSGIKLFVAVVALNFDVCFCALRTQRKLPHVVADMQPSTLLQKNRASVDLEAVMDLRPKPGDRKPVLTVHLMHGLGNQLFQIAALLATALQHSSFFSVALPDVERVAFNRTTYWNTVFRKLKPLLRPPTQTQRNEVVANVSNGSHPPFRRKGECLLQQVPNFNPQSDNCTDATAFHPAWASSSLGHDDCDTVTLYGYFQNKGYFSGYLPLLRNLFWDEASAEKARKRLALLIPSRNQSIVSIHYRLGDYEPNGWVLDSDYYDRALAEIGGRMHQPVVCLIFSDEPQRAWDRTETLQGCEHRILVPRDVDDVTSLYMMGLADGNVLADSTFAYWATLLGKRKRVVVAPLMQGSKAACWSYLRAGPINSVDTNWITLPADRLSQAQMFADDIMNVAPAD